MPKMYFDTSRKTAASQDYVLGKKIGNIHVHSRTLDFDLPRDAATCNKIHSVLAGGPEIIPLQVSDANPSKISMQGSALFVLPLQLFLSLLYILFCPQPPFSSTHNCSTNIARSPSCVVHLCSRKQGDTHPVAIKVIAKNPEKEVDIRREVWIWQKALLGDGHKLIIALNEVHETETSVELVMEYVPDGDLFAVVLDLQEFSEVFAAKIMKQATRIVMHLHSLDIVHRDLQPKSWYCFKTLQEQDVFLKLGNFRAAEMLRHGDALTGVYGSKTYMAPEMKEGKKYGKSVDIYSLGVMAYLLICGTTPFEHQHGVTDLEFPEDEWESITSQAKEWISLCLSYDTSNRPTAKKLLHHPWISYLGTVHWNTKFKKGFDNKLKNLDIDFSQISKPRSFGPNSHKPDQHPAHIDQLFALRRSSQKSCSTGETGESEGMEEKRRKEFVEDKCTPGQERDITLPRDESAEDTGKNKLVRTTKPRSNSLNSSRVTNTKGREAPKGATHSEKEQKDEEIPKKRMKGTYNADGDGVSSHKMRSTGALVPHKSKSVRAGKLSSPHVERRGDKEVKKTRFSNEKSDGGEVKRGRRSLILSDVKARTEKDGKEKSRDEEYGDEKERRGKKEKGKKKSRKLPCSTATTETPEPTPTKCQTPPSTASVSGTTQGTRESTEDHSPRIRALATNSIPRRSRAGSITQISSDIQTPTPPTLHRTGSAPISPSSQQQSEPVGPEASLKIVKTSKEPSEEFEPDNCKKMSPKKPRSLEKSDDIPVTPLKKNPASESTESQITEKCPDHFAILERIEHSPDDLLNPSNSDLLTMIWRELEFHKKTSEYLYGEISDLRKKLVIEKTNRKELERKTAHEIRLLKSELEKETRIRLQLEKDMKFNRRAEIFQNHVYESPAHPGNHERKPEKQPDKRENSGGRDKDKPPSALRFRSPHAIEKFEDTEFCKNTETDEAEAARNFFGIKKKKEKKEIKEYNKRARAKETLLQSFLFDHDFVLLDGILQHMVEKEVTEIDAILKDLSNTLVLTDKIIPFLKHGVEKELIKTEEESTLFRSNSLCAAFMSMHMRNVGAELIEPLIEHLANDPHSTCEIDPAKLAESSEGHLDRAMEANAKNLMLILDYLLDRIILLRSKVPSEIEAILYVIKASVIDKFPNSVNTAIGGFFFLRFLCPVLVTPEIIGKDTTSTAIPRRTLILLSKSLQNLSNGRPFNEPFMFRLNTWLANNRGRMELFLASLAVPSSLPKNASLDKFPFDSGETLIKSICQHFRPISPEISEIFAKNFKPNERQEFSELLAALESPNVSLKQVKKPSKK